MWGIFSGFTFAFLSIGNRSLTRKYDSILISLFECAAATVVLLPFAFSYYSQASLHDLLLMILLGVVFTALSHSLFIAGLKGVKAASASIIASLEPVYGTLLAIVIVKEIPSLRTVLGGVIILTTAILVSKNTLNKR